MYFCKQLQILVNEMEYKYLHILVINNSSGFKYIDLNIKVYLNTNGFTTHLACLGKNIQNIFSNDHQRNFSNVKYRKAQERELSSQYHLNLQPSPTLSSLFTSFIHPYCYFPHPEIPVYHTRHMDNVKIKIVRP